MAVNGFVLPSQANKKAGVSPGISSINLGSLATRISTSYTNQKIATGNIKKVNFADPASVRLAVQNLDKFKNTQDQVKIIQQAAKHNLVDKNKAGQAVLGLMTQAPVKMNLNPLEKVVNTGVNVGKNIGKSVAQPFEDVGKKVGTQFAHLAGPTRSQQGLPGGADLVAQQAAAAKNKTFVNLTKKYPNVGVDASLKAGQMATTGVNPKDIESYLKKASKAFADNQKKMIGDAAQLASYGFGGPEGKAILSGGKPALVDAGKLSAAGAVGGEGAAISEGGDAKQQLISTLAGAGLGLLPVAGAGLRKGGSKVVDNVVDSVAGKATTKAVAPAVSKIDLAVKGGLKKVGTGVKSTVESLPGGKKVTGAISKANDKFQQKAISSLHDVVAPIHKSSKLNDNEKAAITGAIDDKRAALTRSHAAASDTINTDSRISDLRKTVNALSPKNKEAQKVTSDYVNAHEELSRMASGKMNANPERAAAFKKTIAELEAKYGKDKLQAVRKQFIKASEVRRDLLKGVGATEEDFARWQDQNPDYVRIQRKQNPEKMQQGGKGSGGNTNTLQQKINKNATGEAHDALSTLLDSIHQAHHFTATQDFANSVIDAYKKAGVPIKALNTTERALTRKEIITSLKESKPHKDELETLVKQHRGAIKQITRDITKLNKAAQKKLFDKSEDIKNYMIRESTGGKLAGNGSKIIGPIDNPEELLHQYINSPEGGFRDMLNKLAEKNDRIADLRNDLETLSGALTNLKTSRAKNFLKAQGLTAEPARGLPTISYYDKGVKNVYVVPKQVRQAYDHLTAPQQTSLAKAARMVNNVFKYGTTQGNPVFAFKNVVRDQLTSAINSESAWRTHNPGVFVDALVNSITGKSGDYQKFLREYSGEGNFVNVNRNPMRASAEAREFLNRGRDGLNKVTANTPATVVEDAAQLTAKGFNGLVNRLENLTRFQNYKGTTKYYLSKNNPLTGKKYTEAEAHVMGLRAARRNSTDFSDAGDFGRVMNNYVPYFNAAVQGTRTLGRALRERPATTTSKLLLATSPIVGLTYWNMSDPKRAALYAQVPQYQREGNFVIIVGGHKFLIPMSQEFQAVAGVPRTLLETKFGYNPKSFLTDATDFMKALSPVNANNPTGLITGTLPPQLRAAIELGANKNFYTGQQIIPDYVKAQNPGDPTKQVYRDSKGNPTGVSGTSQKIANLLHASPLDVQYYLKNSLGTAVGENALDTVDTATGQQNSGANLVKSFQKSFSSQTNDVKTQFNNKYYPLSDSKNYKQKQINTLLYNGKVNQAQRVASDWNKYVDEQFAPYYSQYGPYVDQNVKGAKDRIGGLKFDIKTSKKGHAYLAY